MSEADDGCTCSSTDYGTAISCPIHGLNVLGPAINEWLDILAHQEPRQATLLVPARVLEQFNALPVEKRQDILDDLDTIAAMHGLGTPTKLIPFAD